MRVNDAEWGILGTDFVARALRASTGLADLL